MRKRWRRDAQDAAGDDGKFGIGFRVTFDRGAAPTKLKMTCRISRTFTDEMLELFQVCRSNSVQRDGKAQKGFRGVAFKPAP